MKDIAHVIDSFPIKEDTLKIQNLIIFFGPPCAGKTTLSKFVSLKYGISRITMDLIRDLFKWTDEHHFNNRDVNEKLFGTMLSYIKSCLNSGSSVVCEALLASEERKLQLIQLSADMQVQIKFIYVWAPLEILLGRLESRLTNGFNSEGQRKETLNEEILTHFFSISKSIDFNSITVNTHLNDFHKCAEMIDFFVNQESKSCMAIE